MQPVSQARVAPVNHKAKGTPGKASFAHAPPAATDSDCLQEPGATVLVAGATGGVGQLLTAKLLDVSGSCWPGMLACGTGPPCCTTTLKTTHDCTAFTDLFTAARLQSQGAEPQRRQAAAVVWSRRRAQPGIGRPEGCQQPAGSIGGGGCSGVLHRDYRLPQQEV